MALVTIVAATFAQLNATAHQDAEVLLERLMGQAHLLNTVEQQAGSPNVDGDALRKQMRAVLGDVLDTLNGLDSLYVQPGKAAQIRAAADAYIKELRGLLDPDKNKVPSSPGTQQYLAHDNLVLIVAQAQADNSADADRMNSLAIWGSAVAIALAAFVVGLVSWRFERSRGDAALMQTEQRSLRKSEERFRSMIANASDVIVIVGTDGIIHYCSPAAESVMGYPPARVYGSAASTYLHSEDQSTARSRAEGLVASFGTSGQAEVRVRHADGTWRMCEVIASNLLRDPSVGGIVITVRDITQRKAAEAELEKLAFHDPLTGLPNRVLFRDRLEQALGRSERRLHSVAIMFLDMDNFKVINDSLGHHVGDQFLVQVGKRLQACVRPGDTVARLGGDEFTVLCEGSNGLSDVALVLQGIQTELARPIVLDGREFFASASIGVALSDRGTDTPETLLRKADLAMYTAKFRGKAQYAVYHTSMDIDAHKRLELESDLRHAIDRGEFRVYYQPSVRLETGEILEVEALVRWSHPGGTLVLPGEFIPLAEETGLVRPIGKWVLEEACRQARIWQETIPMDPPLTVSVNLSPRQMQESNLVDEVAAVLERSGLKPGSLRLEITESVIIQDAEAAIVMLRRLKQLGIQLAIDDFGKGYSSLTYLKRFPFDVLKIDKSFVDRLGEDADDQAIVRAIITLAHSLNLSVTAEGIETAEQGQVLRELGCNRGQGYYFARPMPPEGVTEMLAAQLERGGLAPAG